MAQKQMTGLYVKLFGKIFATNNSALAARTLSIIASRTGALSDSETYAYQRIEENLRFFDNVLNLNTYARIGDEFQTLGGQKDVMNNGVRRIGVAFKCFSDSNKVKDQGKQYDQEMLNTIYDTYLDADDNKEDILKKIEKISKEKKGISYFPANWLNSTTDATGNNLSALAHATSIIVTPDRVGMMNR